MRLAPPAACSADAIARSNRTCQVIFLNTGNRRGALLHSWIVSVHKGSTSGLWSKVVPVPGVVGIRAALGGAMAHRQALDQVCVCVCVCVYVCARARACVRACVCALMCVRA